MKKEYLYLWIVGIISIGGSGFIILLNYYTWSIMYDIPWWVVVIPFLLFSIPAMIYLVAYWYYSEF